jgi:hypothetical protein
MRQRFVQVLQGDEGDDASSDVIRCFWTHTKPLPVRFERRVDARVVDLTAWAQRHRDVER